MKKAGAVATRLGVHSDTVRDWTSIFAEFFSDGAKKTTSFQRVYDLNDEIILNTIHELRQKGIEFEEIRARLRSGERVEMLPAANEPLPPESALSVYTEMKELRVQIAERDGEIERLRTESKEERERLQAEIRQLDRENAVLKYRLERLEADEAE